jgi:polyvinyl alcohol dehydrogenase (cytochrome)
MGRALVLWMLILGQWAALAAAEAPVQPSNSALVSTSSDPNDWPMYNRDVIGTRHNPAEKSLGKDNVGQLIEKWRFPPADSKEFVGVAHATAVVNGHVYFGTETTPTFYKLTPEGRLRWSYRPERRSKLGLPTIGLPTAGFMNAALVTNDAVFVGDMGGMIYALDRISGSERWKIDTRVDPFPGAHSSNCVFAAPILAEGLVVVAGGAFEHAVAATPWNRGCTGRGFVVALRPESGNVAWKYDVGPEPGPLDPPVTIKYGKKERTFYYGPSTSSVWCTPSFDVESHTVFFGTDCHNSPRQPTADDPRHSTKHSCAVIAVDSRTGAEKWVTQITANDVWNYALPSYDPETGYKDQSVGDTPKIYTIEVGGKATKVVGCGTKNGGFYVLNAATGEMLNHTPIYTGSPGNVPKDLDPRMLALPSAIGGLQTGCATDGRAIFTNGIDFLGSSSAGSVRQPSGGRVVSISLDTREENWRHERPKVTAVGGTAEKPAFTDVGDPVASGIALANGVAYFTTTVSNRLVAVDMSNGVVLKEVELGPVWCGPTVSRGRVYVGTGNLLFAPENPQEAYFPKSARGSIRSFGLPGDDEVTRIKEE